MKDKVTLDKIQFMHPKVRDEVTAIYDEIIKALTGRAICRFSFTLRTFAEQDALYAQGRTKPGKIVTNAKGGQSIHNYGLALDIVLLYDSKGDGTFDTALWEENKDFDGDGVSDWKEIVKIFKAHGWEWGGDWKFKDSPHFQKVFGLSWQALKGKIDAGQVTEETINGKKYKWAKI